VIGKYEKFKVEKLLVGSLKQNRNIYKKLTVLIEDSWGHS
jgi:hypothetical protein